MFWIMFFLEYFLNNVSSEINRNFSSCLWWAIQFIYYFWLLILSNMLKYALFPVARRVQCCCFTFLYFFRLCYAICLQHSKLTAQYKHYIFVQTIHTVKHRKTIQHLQLALELFLLLLKFIEFMNWVWMIFRLLFRVFFRCFYLASLAGEMRRITSIMQGLRLDFFTLSASTLLYGSTAL